MKLRCKKCMSIVTDDLIKTTLPYNSCFVADKVLDDEYDLSHYKFIDGLYKIKNQSFDEGVYVNRIAYALNPTSVVAHLEKSRGCCSYDYADIVCSCGESLGYAKDDCWQNTVAFIIKTKVFK